MSDLKTASGEDTAIASDAKHDKDEAIGDEIENNRCLCGCDRIDGYSWGSSPARPNSTCGSE